MGREEVLSGTSQNHLELWVSIIAIVLELCIFPVRLVAVDLPAPEDIGRDKTPRSAQQT